MNIVLDEASHEYLVDGQIEGPCVTELLKWEGLVDDTWFTEYGRLRGKLTHDVIHFHNTGTLDEASVDTALEGYFRAYLRFLADTGFVVTGSEIRVFWQKFRVPGTLDLRGYFPKSPKILCIGDNKCNHVYDWTAIQTAFYALAHGGYFKRFGLELHANGTYKIKWFTNPADMGAAYKIAERYREEESWAKQQEL